MIKHNYTENSEINFSKLEERIKLINKPERFTFWQFQRNLLDGYFLKNFSVEEIGPILIMATGGSKAVAYFLQMLFEKVGMISEVIEPRDFFYKQNISSYKNLIAISTSGKTNGIEEAFKNFKENKYIISSHAYLGYKDVIEIPYSNKDYIDFGEEKSFVSLASTLGQMAIILDLSYLDINLDSNHKKVELINNKISHLIQKSKQKIDDIKFNFKDTEIIEVLSGYDTKVSSTILESNLVETGTVAPIIHDKGSYCHGRSNLMFQNPNNPMLYLTHNSEMLDKAIIEVLKEEYPNIFVFDTLGENENIFWKEYYLSLQMFYLSKKIAYDKGIDLTCPEYNPNVIKKLYKFKGSM